jgi:hypothetical protein
VELQADREEAGQSEELGRKKEGGREVRREEGEKGRS